MTLNGFGWALADSVKSNGSIGDAGSGLTVMAHRMSAVLRNIDLSNHKQLEQRASKMINVRGSYVLPWADSVTWTQINVCHLDQVGETKRTVVQSQTGNFSDPP